MLGFLFNLDLPRERVAARFARTASFRPRTLGHIDMAAHDSRHGRVLLRDPYGDRQIILMRDPVTDERREVSLPPAVPFEYWVTAVLCAAAAPGSGRECEPAVAFAATTAEGLTCDCVYSSKAAAWGDTTYADAEHLDAFDDMDMRPSALVGNTINFIPAHSKTIVYDLGRRQLEHIDPPFLSDRYAVIMPAPGGGLGFAAVRGTSLYLCSREAGPDGIAAWTQRRVIELNALLPARVPLKRGRSTVGFTEGLNAIFVAIELKSGRVKKVSSRQAIDIVIPYMSFYTPGNV